VEENSLVKQMRLASDAGNFFNQEKLKVLN